MNFAKLEYTNTVYTTYSLVMVAYTAHPRLGIYHTHSHVWYTRVTTLRFIIIDCGYIVEFLIEYQLYVGIGFTRITKNVIMRIKMDCMSYFLTEYM